MPLDATGSLVNLLEETIADDPLSRLGITPLSATFVEDYKTNYRRAWIEANKDRLGPGPFVWYRRDYDEWCKMMRDTYNHLYGVERGSVVLTMNYFLTRMALMGDDHVAPPQAIIDLAERVHRELPGARIGMDYFDTDPVLHVTYPVGGEIKTAYLAIWEFGQVKAISALPVVRKRATCSVVPLIACASIFFLNLMIWG